MRRLLLAAMMFGAAQGAYAADMPDLPVLRGSLPDGLSTVRTVWQGYYVGGQASYGAVTSKPPATLNSDLSAAAPALGSASARGLGWGAFAGYNSQWDDVVIGIEGNYVHSGLDAFTTSTNGVPITSSATIRSTDFGSVRLRAGYMIGSFLPYAFVGGGMGGQTVDRGVFANPLPASVTKTNLVYGYSAGVGVDVMLMAGLFLRAEYEYQRVTSNIESNVNSARLGLGYKF